MQHRGVFRMVNVLPADDLAILAHVVYGADGIKHEPFGKPGGPGLWHHKGVQLPAYVQEIAHDLVERGMDESRAIATAVGRCKVWCAGGDNVKPDTKAKACAAVAEWERLKAEHNKGKHASGVSAVGPHGYIHGWIKVGGIVRTPDGQGKVVSKPGNGQVTVAPLKGGGHKQYHESQLKDPISQPGSEFGQHKGSDAERVVTLQGMLDSGRYKNNPAKEAKIRQQIAELKLKMTHNKDKHASRPDDVEAVGPKGYEHGWIKVAAPALKEHGFGTVFGSEGVLGAHIGTGGAGPHGSTHALAVSTPQSNYSNKYQVELTRLNPKTGGESGGRTTVKEHDTVESALSHARALLAKHSKGNVHPYDEGLHASVMTRDEHGSWQVMDRVPRKVRQMAAAGTMQVPQLVTLPDVELMAAGTWDLSSGRQTFTRDDLESAVEAAQCPAVGNAVIKLGHVDPRFNEAGQDNPQYDGQPAIGAVTNLRLDPTGSKLHGDLAGMPGWLASISASAFPRRSIEGSYGFKCQVGHTHQFVLTGLALLGVTPPGVGVLNALPDIAALYGLQASAQPERPWQFTVPEGEPAVPVTEEDVRRAWYATGAPPDWWITELQMAPSSQLIVASGDGKVYRVPYQIRDENTISFGDAEEMASYAAVAASRGTGALATYASAEESRSGVTEDDDAGEVDAAANGGWVMRDGTWCYDPDNDGDDDSSPAGDADNSHWDKAGKQLKAIPPNPEGRGGKPMAAANSAQPPDDGGSETEGGSGDVTTAGHGPMTTTHTHAHPAYGSQGSDATHAHSHTHKGDANHAHAHAGAGNTGNGGTDVDFTDEQLNSLRDSLGVGADEELDAAKLVTAAAALKATKTVRAGKLQLPPGVVTIEQEVLDNINKRVEAADHFRAKVERSERDDVINNAIRAGKFSASRRPHWQRLWDADPDGTREVLASLQKNAVPVEDIGGGGGSLDDEAFDAEYAALYPPGTFKRD
jgi:hypothetical protein